MSTSKTLLMNSRTFLTMLAFCLFTFATLPLQAQSLYEIKFSDKLNTQYKAFLVFFHENNCYMRIAYNTDNRYNVVEVIYKMEYGSTATGLKYCMLRGSNPAFITEKTLQQSYYPDHFIWFYNNSTQQYDDLYTTDDSLFRSENYRRTISYVKLDALKITDSYLREFFGSDEMKYTALKKMCGITPVILKPLDQLLPAKLHLVIVANTLDPKIGISCAVDRTNLKNEFRQVATALGIGFSEYIVDEYNFSKEKVLSTLNSVYPGKNDIVLFIYRGHGFRWKNQTEKWPRLDLRTSSYVQPSAENSMNLKEVKDILDRKGARLNVVLGDCCNDEVNTSAVTGNNYWSFQVDNTSDVSKLRNLFVNSRGSIISAAAKPGEVSWASTQGGLYSISFVQAFHQEISYFATGYCNWETILSKTVQYAWNKSLPQNCGNCSPQNGIHEVSVTAY
jgi:hypothetical protein